MSGENRRESDAGSDASADTDAATETGTQSEPSVLADLKRSFGLFAGIAVVLFTGAIAVVQLLEVPLSALDSGSRMWAFGMAILIAAFCSTVWLEEGGFERLGSDPAAGGQFVWLALLYVPLATLPLRGAAGEFGARTATVDLLIVLGSMILAGWLSFFRGLAMLGIEPRHVGHVAVASLVGVVGYAVVGGALPAKTDDPTLRSGALLVLQLVALWVGLGGIGDRLLER